MHGLGGKFPVSHLSPEISNEFFKIYRKKSIFWQFQKSPFFSNVVSVVFVAFWVLLLCFFRILKSGRCCYILLLFSYDVQLKSYFTSKSRSVRGAGLYLYMNAIKTLAHPPLFEKERLVTFSGSSRGFSPDTVPHEDYVSFEILYIFLKIKVHTVSHEESVSYEIL